MDKKEHRTRGEMMLERVHQICTSGNYLRLPYFRLSKTESNRGRLPYPTHEVMVGEDKCLVYDIPQEKMQDALDKANAFKRVGVSYPMNKKKRVPLTDGKYYYFRQAIIIYYKRHNYILPPMFFKTGATGEGWCIFSF